MGPETPDHPKPLTAIGHNGRLVTEEYCLCGHSELDHYKMQQDPCARCRCTSFKKERSYEPYIVYSQVIGPGEVGSAHYTGYAHYDDEPSEFCIIMGQEVKNVTDKPVTLHIRH